MPNRRTRRLTIAQPPRGGQAPTDQL